MRIAIVSSNRRKVGGIETYLDSVIPELVAKRIELALWHEIDAPDNRRRITVDPNMPTWNVSEMGAQAALAGLKKWAPHLIYAHGLNDPQLEKETLTIAPAVFFAHAYYGTCISGSKSWANGTVRPCMRTFGPPCLAHYYPHRCGGLNPLTMLKEYRRQQLRLSLLQGYQLILTASEHMRAEFANHGLRAERLPLLVPALKNSHQWTRSSSVWRLLFVGRMDRLKGGLVLIESLPAVRAALDRPVHVTFAGDGEDRALWESRARQTAASCQGLSFEFQGWVDGQTHDALFADADLLVMPSLWPEPFGLAGPQAGLHGVPSAAFGLGGISDWLRDGVNGFIAEADPPTARGLCEAIVKSLRDPELYLKLRDGALKMARTFGAGDHVARLTTIFEEAIGASRT